MQLQFLHINSVHEQLVADIKMEGFSFVTLAFMEKLLQCDWQSILDEAVFIHLGQIY